MRIQVLVLALTSCFLAPPLAAAPVEESIHPQGSATAEKRDSKKKRLVEGLAAYQRGHYKRALTLWIPLAKNGDPEAQYRLGAYYESEIEQLDPRLKQSLGWYNKAAAQGHIGARYKVEFYRHYPFPRQPENVNWALAVAFYEARAAEGDVDAMANLGLMYELGAGVPKDKSKKFSWYLKAAELGDVRGQSSLAAIMSDSAPEESFYWYRKAAEQGSPEALKMVGFLYRDGKGVAKSEIDAIEWFARAARNGDRDGWSMIAYLYDTEWSELYNPVLACVYYEVAVREGAIWAGKDRLEKCRARLTADQRREVKAMVSAWKPEQLPATTTTWRGKQAAVASSVAVTAPPDSGLFPAAPLKRLGVVSCSTRCINADCYRTYDDGRKVRYRANQKWNPVEDKFEWDPGTC